MHKNTKLTPTLRREIYKVWLNQKHSLRYLAEQYHVDKNIIKTVLIRGKMGDFTVHDSINHRYRTIEYGLRRLSKTEKVIEKWLIKKHRRETRYEKSMPGEMVHGDTRRMPSILKTGKFRQVIAPSEYLFIWIDDYSRWLIADLLPDKTMWSSAIFLDLAAVRIPFPVQYHYSDNGGEYRGNKTHAFVSGCTRLGIQQRFTKPKHPWTNGKAERIIKTIVYEWYNINKNKFQSAEERRMSLYQFVDWYNHQRPHQSLNNLTPFQKLAQYYKSGDNAC